jgi:hypothetical protein
LSRASPPPRQRLLLMAPRPLRKPRRIVMLFDTDPSAPEAVEKGTRIALSASTACFT